MSQKTVLFADDDFAIRYLVEHQLKSNDIVAILARDGQSALRAAREHKPDLIVLDVMMPDMDGFQVCEAIKNDPSLAAIPVVFLTALAMREHKQQAFAAGAEDYMVKPLLPDEFMAHVQAALRRPGAGTQSDPSVDGGGRIVALFGAKGGVGTTTVAIQLSEALALREDMAVALIDLDLPIGGIAPNLSLYTRDNVVKLLNEPIDQFSLSQFRRFAQQHRSNLWVVPAPGTFTGDALTPQPDSLRHLLSLLSHHGLQVVLDLGSKLNPLTIAALRQAGTTFLITSGQPVANRIGNSFLESAEQLRLNLSRLMPVVNELHGSEDGLALVRMPVARIPHASESSRSRLWLTEQGIRKLVSIVT